MADPFQTYIQLELPKRPYLEDDVAEEGVIVRRGPGPRQLGAVVLAEGEVLGMDQGILKGIPNVGAGGTVGHTHTQSVGQTQWVITHGKNNKNVVITLLDQNDKVIFADEMEVTSNVVTVNFLEAQIGKANLVFI